MAEIKTLIPDIYKTLEEKVPAEKAEEIIQRFGEEMKRQLRRRLTEKERGDTLRMSNLGQRCARKLWYTVNMPEAAEKFSGQELLKFLYGDMVETLILHLAEVAGHDVAGQQDELVINGVKGHRDAIIDGTLADVKSASPGGMGKFKDHKLLGDDPFGYYDQLNAYLYASRHDPALADKDGAAFVAIDKSSAYMCLDYYPASGKDYDAHVDELRRLLAQPEPPPREFEDIEDGRSGNRKLGLECSYCAFKRTCWPGLRTYKYAGGPRHLTVVARLPDVVEASWTDETENE